MRLIPVCAFLGLAVIAAAQAPPAAVKPKPAAAAKPKPAAAKPAAPKPAAAAKPKPKPAPASSEPAVLTVGSEKITKADFESLLENVPPNVRAQASDPAGRRRVAQQLADLKALAQEARKQGFEQDPKVRAQLQVQYDQILASMYLRHMSEKSQPDEASLREYFEANKSQYEQSKARHILVRFKGSRVPLRDGQPDRTEDEALAYTQELRKRIAGGEDFATVAKAESDDVGSGAQGGDLGTFGRGQMVPTFDQAAFTLPIGQLSEPVRSDFGFHLIEVQERKGQSFEEVKPQLEQRRKPEMQEELRKKISGAATVTYDETYFGPAPSAP